MTTYAITEAPSHARTERYREAERVLWRHFGVEASERFVELESPSARLRVLEIGTGRPVLFVAGTPGTGPYWGGLVRRLPGIRCLILDRPGWGLSSPIDYSKHEYKTVVADVLAGTLDALGLDRANVVGNSLGNLWALRLAGRHPSRVDRTVLLGGGPLLPEIRIPPFIRLLASPLGALLVRLPQKPKMIRSQLRQAGHGTSLDAGRIPDEFVAWRAALSRETASMRNERDMVRAIVSGKTFRPGVTLEDEELAGIRQPTLHVYGTADPVGSVDVWTRVAGLLPRGKLSLVEGAGHVPWLDDPTRVARDISRFLTE